MIPAPFISGRREVAGVIGIVSLILMFGFLLIEKE
jgi:hypothetical protein